MWYFVAAFVALIFGVLVPKIIKSSKVRDWPVASMFVGSIVGYLAWHYCGGSWFAYIFNGVVAGFFGYLFYFDKWYENDVADPLSSLLMRQSEELIREYEKCTHSSENNENIIDVGFYIKPDDQPTEVNNK